MISRNTCTLSPNRQMSNNTTSSINLTVKFFYTLLYYFILESFAVFSKKWKNVLLLFTRSRCCTINRCIRDSDIVLRKKSATEKTVTNHSYWICLGNNIRSIHRVPLSLWALFQYFRQGANALLNY